MTIKALYPTVRPTLNLDFAKTKALDPRITFTRASTATFVGPDGLIKTAASGVARFDHNPTTGESLGLLVEEQRTNLLQRSEEFDNAYWSPQSTAPTVTANTAISPSGTLTADTITFAAADSRIQSDLIPVTAGVSYTFSVYVKAVGVSLNKCRLAFFDGAQQNSTDFTVSNLTWTRISNTFVAASTASARLQIRNATDVLANSLFFWGAQLEAGAFPTSYIPTVASTVTRAADVASMTGTNFSSWYNQNAGTLFINYGRSIATTSAFYIYYTIDDGTNSNRLFTYGNNNNSNEATELYSSGVLQYIDIVPASSKHVTAFASNNFIACGNGALGTLDTSGTLPSSMTRLTLAGNSGGFTFKRLVYYPTRPPGAQLQALTAT